MRHSLGRFVVAKFVGGNLERLITDGLLDQGRQFAIEPPLALRALQFSKWRYKGGERTHTRNVSQVIAHVKEFHNFFRKSCDGWSPMLRRA
jgi:hypothetical protein